jgi:hypothetical protein
MRHVREEGKKLTVGSTDSVGVNTGSLILVRGDGEGSFGENQRTVKVT